MIRKYYDTFLDGSGGTDNIPDYLKEASEKLYRYATKDDLDEHVLPFNNSLVNMRRKAFIAGATSLESKRYHQSPVEDEKLINYGRWVRENDHRFNAGNLYKSPTELYEQYKTEKDDKRVTNG